jgi:hypothetical protein
MAATYELIGSYTTGSGGNTSVTFSSIPNTYTDLVVKISTRNTGSSQGTGVDVYLNGTASPSGIIIYGTGSGVGSASNPSSFISNDNDTTANTFSNGELYIPNYLSSNTKVGSSDSVEENNSAGSYSVLYANIWSGFTSAITSIKLQSADGRTFYQYSTWYLYGIKNS